jgi:high affinity Mn2+ porin
MRFYFNDLECAMCWSVPNCKSLRKPCAIPSRLGQLSTDGAWFDPEIDQGSGLGDTLGAAGYPSGEAYKVGAHRPDLRIRGLLFGMSFRWADNHDKSIRLLTSRVGSRRRTMLR